MSNGNFVCALRVTFIVRFFYIFKSSSFIFAPSPSIAHVQRVTYRGEVPSAHRGLVQSTAATSRPTTPRPIGRRVPQSVALDPWRRGRIRGGGERWRRREGSSRRKERGEGEEASSCMLAFSSTRGCSSGPLPCWLATVASSLVPGACCCVVGGEFESCHRTSSTRPHEADRWKNWTLPSARLPSELKGRNKDPTGSSSFGFACVGGAVL